MDKAGTISALAALAQTTRLDVFQLLTKHEPHGLPAGEIARVLSVPHNTMSSHLAILTRAGLISPERRSRSVVYRAVPSRFQEIALYLIRDCCEGRPEVCAPLVRSLAPCRPPVQRNAKQKKGKSKCQDAHITVRFSAQTMLRDLPAS